MFCFMFAMLKTVDPALLRKYFFTVPFVGLEIKRPISAKLILQSADGITRRRTGRALL